MRRSDAWITKVDFEDLKAGDLTADARSPKYADDNGVYLFALTDAERAMLDAIAAGTHQLIPTEALKWLHGEGEDFECAPEHYFRGKAPPYWWRSEFRRRIEAAAPAPGGGG